MSLLMSSPGNWRLASGEPPQVPDDLAGFQRPRRVGTGPPSQCWPLVVADGAGRALRSWGASAAGAPPRALRPRGVARVGAGDGFDHAIGARASGRVDLPAGAVVVQGQGLASRGVGYGRS